MQVDRYSSLHKLLRVTAKVLCFIRKVKWKTSGTTREKMASNDVDDLKAAEVFWIQATQRNSFSEELKLLFVGNRRRDQSEVQNQAVWTIY